LLSHVSVLSHSLRILGALRRGKFLMLGSTYSWMTCWMRLLVPSSGFVPNYRAAHPRMQ
jgi:hypothetical protein